MRRLLSVAVLAAGLLSGCGREDPAPPVSPPPGGAVAPKPVPPPPARRARAFKVVHVFVALCDNRNQGIVPVPASLGNGQDPKSNLYWGAMYGVKTFFSRSPHWKPLAGVLPSGDPEVLDRAAFEGEGVRVLADAYDGAQMKTALRRFLEAAAGLRPTEAGPFQAGSFADLVCFVGHNGLMDARVDFPRNGGRPNPAAAVVLACKSRAYFLEPLRLAGCEPLVTTTGLMAPEGYVLDAVIRAWAGGEKDVRLRAAQAYAKHQKCGEAAALNLFSQGR